MAKAIKLKADIMWAFLDTPNEMSGTYQVDLCNLSPAAVGALEDLGVTVRSKEGKGFFITCKSRNPIRAYDDEGVQIEGVQIGNGSVATALVSTYEWKWKGKQGISPSLKKLQIVDLQAYEGAEEDLEIEDVDGEEVL